VQNCKDYSYTIHDEVKHYTKYSLQQLWDQNFMCTFLIGET